MMSLALVHFDSSAWSPLSVIAILVGLVLVALTYTRSLRDQESSVKMRWILLALRLIAIATLVLSLLHPSWVNQTIVEQKPVLAVVLDNSGSMDQPADPSTKQSPTRYQKALDLLQKQIVPALSSSHDLRYFDVQGRPLRASELPVKPTIDSSPLSDTLLRVERDLAGQHAVGAVLLSDGAESADAPSAGATQRLQLPIHTVNLVSAAAVASGPMDLAIGSVTANRRALVGNTVRVAVDANSTGSIEATDVPVTILDGDKIVARSTMSLKPGQASARSELEFVPRRPGEFTYTVQLGSLPGERDLSNNRSTFPLTVRAKALTVLYIDGVLRWEGKFIRQTLMSDPDINVISSIRTTASTERGSEGLLLPEQLEKIDVVILGDVEATHFSGKEIESLKAWVTDHGGGLVLTGGYHSFGSQGFGRSDLRQILPVEFSAQNNPQLEQPFHLQMTDEGRESPIFHLSGDRVKDTGFYQSLPALNGCSRIASVKPGAQILAVNPQARLGDDGGPLPVMVIQEIGAGRSMVFAVDTTWKWRLVVGGFTGDDSFYRRFWGQLVRWMATGQEDAAIQRLTLSTDRSRFGLGQTIELRVNLRPTAASKDLKPGSRAKAVAAIPVSSFTVLAQAIDETGARVTVPLTESAANPDGSRQFRGSVAASHPGRMDLLVIAEPGAEARKNSPASAGTETRSLMVQVDRPDQESLDPRPNPRWLAQASRETGGRNINPDQIAEWAKTLPATPTQTQRVQTTGLWYHPVLGIVLLLALCIEWFLRRRRRLA